VLLDGRRATTCLTFAVDHDGARITTAAGLAEGTTMQPRTPATGRIDFDLV
jgi:xanthine dehydrogenase YagT iron-sulfur-binding subunit